MERKNNTNTGSPTSFSASCWPMVETWLQNVALRNASRSLTDLNSDDAFMYGTGVTKGPLLTKELTAATPAQCTPFKLMRGVLNPLDPTCACLFAVLLVGVHYVFPSVAAFEYWVVRFLLLRIRSVQGESNEIVKTPDLELLISLRHSRPPLRLARRHSTTPRRRRSINRDGLSPLGWSGGPAFMHNGIADENKAKHLVITSTRVVPWELIAPHWNHTDAGCYSVPYCDSSVRSDLISINPFLNWLRGVDSYYSSQTRQILS
ncbi:hypothetical protein AVEN_101501-1 [Araneus ventricosus]|uniref:Uncharacterized protein n=1 Tax=Araneus ventricosus TaxID=182803 RepID=A0A4Y2FB22_ARAVE|nr:hypothetical protein AVEN_101501-1 [Araneus ventricosus]